ncbi:MAG: histidinol-phosphate transaminase [Clostridiales bacterium]|jgi:histidinol-phosphate aminotransferase|nr:histidinol-phosphate transaminase [Clostridiales bacterium]
MSRFFLERYKDLKSYAPGEQPEDFSKFIKLNTNEMPYPPSQKVIKAIDDLQLLKLNLYPPVEFNNLKAKIAKFYDISRENIFLSNGSDEILSFIFLGFFRDGANVAFPDITYGFYNVYAQLYGSNADIIPLSSDFTINIKDYINIGKNIVIANPNAPTGICLSLSDVEKIVKGNQDNLVVIDEAYIDFGGESAVPLIKKYDNVLVVQTFSKSRSLAGARLGFAMGDRKLIDGLRKIKYSTNPYNVNRLTLTAGEASFDDDVYFNSCCKKISETREYLTKELENIGFLVLNSKANFIFAKPFNITANNLYLKLKEKGILIRYFEQERINDFVRISIGTKEDTDILLKEIRGII